MKKPLMKKLLVLAASAALISLVPLSAMAAPGGGRGGGQGGGNHGSGWSGGGSGMRGGWQRSGGWSGGGGGGGWHGGGGGWQGGGGGWRGGGGWHGGGWNGGHWHGGWWGPRVGFGFGYPYWPYYGYYGYYPGYYPAPYYDSSVVYADPPVYSSSSDVYAAPAPPAVEREVVYPHGRYVLQGDGVTTPYRWIWVPNAPERQ